MISVSLVLFNCRKNNNVFNTTDALSFSTDTVLFDTLFTTIGSTTKRFRIYNNSNQKIKIANIHLGQGTQSMFRINIDGIAGVNFNDVEIPAKDSLFVFVEVTIDPNNSNVPMIVEDQINFLTNGQEQKVVLNAFGQDAYFHVNEIFTTNHLFYNTTGLKSLFKYSNV